MVIHHGFEMPPREFESRKAWPVGGDVRGDWRGEYASQSPLNALYVTNEGGGAEGTAGYLALPGAHADQFYAEATPRWYRPRRALDLRHTRAMLHLKAISPLRTAAGYAPYLFIDDYDEPTNTYCGWYHRQPLVIGDEWTLNAVDLVNDESQWTRYSRGRSLDAVLSHVGFIGVMFLRGTEFRGVDACGVLGIDEFRYNVPLA